MCGVCVCVVGGMLGREGGGRILVGQGVWVGAWAVWLSVCALSLSVKYAEGWEWGMTWWPVGVGWGGGGGGGSGGVCLCGGWRERLLTGTWGLRRDRSVIAYSRSVSFVSLFTLRCCDSLLQVRVFCKFVYRTLL